MVFLDFITLCSIRGFRMRMPSFLVDKRGVGVTIKTIGMPAAEK